MVHSHLPPIDTEHELIDEFALADMADGFGKPPTPMQRATEHIGVTLQNMATGKPSGEYPVLDAILTNSSQRRPRAPGHGALYHDDTCTPTSCDDPLHWGSFDNHKPAEQEPLLPAPPPLAPLVPSGLIQDVYPSVPQQLGRLEGQVDGLHQAIGDVQGRLANAATREDIRALDHRITNFYKHIDDDLRQPMNSAIKRLEGNIGLLSKKRLWKDRFYIVWVILAIGSLAYTIAPPIYRFVTNVIM